MGKDGVLAARPRVATGKESPSAPDAAADFTSHARSRAHTAFSFVPLSGRPSAPGRCQPGLHTTRLPTSCCVFTFSLPLLLLITFSPLLFKQTNNAFVPQNFGTLNDSSRSHWRKQMQKFSQKYSRNSGCNDVSCGFPLHHTRPTFPPPSAPPLSLFPSPPLSPTEITSASLTRRPDTNPTRSTSCLTQWAGGRGHYLQTGGAKPSGPRQERYRGRDRE